MTNDTVPRPIDLEDLRWWVNYVKTIMSYQVAQYFETALLYRLFGDNSSEKRELVESIRKYYSVEFDEKIIEEVEKRISAKIEKRHNLPKIVLDEEQIATALVQIQDELKGRTDYYSIYRILVDFCDWPEKMTDFCKRLTRLPIQVALTYPFGEYDEGNPNFSSIYQAIQKGENKSWPDNYQKWQSFTGDPTFVHRMDVATKFLEILQELEKEYYSDTI